MKSTRCTLRTLAHPRPKPEAKAKVVAEKVMKPAITRL